jgi:Fmp27, WPPW motif-containing RBG unit
MYNAFLYTANRMNEQVKAFLEHFQADLHQREEETSVKRRGVEPKVIRHKPFSAIDVVITSIDLRALFAVFAEPEKKSFPLKESLPSMTRFWEYLDPTPLFSTWVDMDDFMEVDWLPNEKPNLYLHEAAHCPRFVYFKRTPRRSSSQDGYDAGRSQTKFGDEETHVCLMGKEQSRSEGFHIVHGLTSIPRCSRGPA